MKTLLLASALIVAATPAFAQLPPGPNLCGGRPCTYVPGAGIFPAFPAFVPPPSYYGLPPLPPPPDYGPPPPMAAPLPPQPLGWVFTRYTSCPEPRACPVVFASVAADGLNVRAVPGGPPITSVVNGTPLAVLQRQGQWTLVAPACELTPTFAWSWNAGVPLMRCWVY